MPASRTSRVLLPHAAGALTARQVATAYGLPADADGTGQTIGIIELGGAYLAGDMARAGLTSGQVQVVSIDGAKPTSDGPDGADGEVMLDIEIAAAVAPGAKIVVVFAPNTDAGFYDGLAHLVANLGPRDAISCSWGGPESSWDAATMDRFEALFAAARAKGIAVFCAAGDAGSRDGTGRNTTDFPASAPSAIGTGGTRLQLKADGTRQAETVWNDDPTSSATGGGVSGHFRGRTVPDVAGNADPVTGFRVVVDSQAMVVGGTSAVAPLFAACWVGVQQVAAAAGAPVADFLNTLLTNPGACFDVVSGDNGGYRAGTGRDDCSGLGVPDFGKLLTVLTSGVQVPAPGGTPTPTPVPVTPAPVGVDGFPLVAYNAFAKHPTSRPRQRTFITACDHWLSPA